MAVDARDALFCMRTLAYTLRSCSTDNCAAMVTAIPYTYYACPCTDISEDTRFEYTRFVGRAADTEELEEGSTINPAEPRANHILFPLEDLLFCNECHEIRCPRCYYEEALYYYCPNCLMETAATAVKTETNR